MEIEILYEDNETLVVNKPVGLVVNRAESVKGETLQDWIENYLNFKNQVLDIKYGEKDKKVFFDRSGLCHRLDKETSGCLVIAKNPDALHYYLKVFKKRKIKKEYVALVHGKVEPEEGVVVLPVKRSLFDREKWQVHYEGKRAETSWKVLERYNYDNSIHWKNSLSYLRLNLKTGRTHQIRVHLSFLGWPIFSDEKYLNKELAIRDRKLLNHHFLHSEKISFISISGKKINVVAPLPLDCRMLLKSMVSD